MYYGDVDYTFDYSDKRSGQKMDESLRGMLEELVEDGGKDLHYLRFGKRGNNNNKGLSDYLVRPALSAIRKERQQQ